MAHEDTFIRVARRLTALATVVLTASICSSACAPDGPDGPRAETDDRGDADDGQAVDVDAAIDAAVEVRADGCGPRVGLGTGTAIGERLIITAAHVVAGATAVTTVDADGRRRDAEVVAFDPDLDLAVLRPADAATPAPLPIRAGAARAGEFGVVVLPRSGRQREGGDIVEVDVAEVRVVRRANIETTDISRERDVQRAGFEIEGDIDPGDSGAAVVTSDGVIGIVWARSLRNDRRAWGIDIPHWLADPIDRAALASGAPTDVGPCIR